MTRWIIENIVKESSFRELSDAAKKAGFPTQDIRGDFAFADIGQYRKDCVVFNGSIEMCKLASSILIPNENYPVLFCTWENYLCSKFYGSLGEFLFNDDFVIVPFSELKRRLYFFYGLFAKEAMLFIRPNSGEKTFKGGTVDIQEFARFYDQFESERDELVIVSSPKNIRGEWRFVCSEWKEIIAVSSYRYQGLTTRIPSAPVGATELCKKVLDAGYYPDPVFCIDVAEDNDGNFWVMELTSFSSAGLYACDKDAIVKRVSAIAEEKYNARIQPE